VRAWLAHPDDAFGLVVVEVNPQVMGEAEVVTGAAGHPGGQGVALLLELAAAAGVQDDPGHGRPSVINPTRQADSQKPEPAPSAHQNCGPIQLRPGKFQASGKIWWIIVLLYLPNARIFPINSLVYRIYEPVVIVGGDHLRVDLGSSRRG
jgi:hypothetical protein